MSSGPSSLETSPPLTTELPFRGGHLVLLVSVTLLAALLRLYKLGEWSFWIDEAHTFRDVMMPWDAFWAHPRVSYYPLSYLVLRAASVLFPANTEGWLRLPFVFFGIISVPMIALAGRPMVGRGAALLAALFLALSPWHIYWSQSCRWYSMVLFFGIVAAGSFYEAARRRSTFFLGASLLGILAAGLCHPSAYLLLGAFVGYAFLGWRRRSRSAESATQRWAPFLVLMIFTISVVGLLPLLAFFRLSKPDFSTMHLVQTTAYFIRLPLLVSAAAALLWLFQRGERCAAFLLSWSLLPLVALLIAASGIVKVTAYYAFYTLPAFCLLAGAAVMGLIERWQVVGFRRRILRAIPLAMLLLDMTAYDYLYFTHQYGDRPRWREAADYIVHQPGLRKRVITTNEPSMLYYIERRRYWEQPDYTLDVVAFVKALNVDFGAEGWRIDKGDERLDDCMKLAKAHLYQLYVVITEPELEEMDPSGLTNTFLREHFLQTRHYTNWTGPKDMTVLVYEMR